MPINLRAFLARFASCLEYLISASLSAMFLTLLLRYWHFAAIGILIATNAITFKLWTGSVESAAAARGAYTQAIEHQNARVAEWESAAVEARKSAQKALRSAQEATKKAEDRVATIRKAPAPTGDCEARENAALDLIRQYRER